MDTELERMVVRLIGESTSFDSMTSSAISDLGKLENVSDAAGTSITGDFETSGKAADALADTVEEASKDVNSANESMGDSASRLANKGSSSFKRMGVAAKGLLASLGPIAVALTGIAGVAGFAGMTNAAFDTIDATAKMADKIGIGTEELAGLRHAANLSGVENGKLDMSLQRMTRRLAEASEGGGAASKAIETLGLDAKELANSSPDQAFKAITEAMEDVEDQGQKVKLAFSFFDSEGVDLINTMAGGVEGLNDAMKEASELGIGVSREDALLVEQANDAWDKMLKSFSGIFNMLAVELSPMFTAIANQGAEIGKFVSGAFRDGMIFGKQFINILGSIWNQTTSLIASVFDWGISYESMWNIASQIFDFIIDGMIVTEFSINNIGDIWEVVWGNMKLIAVDMFEDLKHFFTVEVPTMLSFFGNNWQSIFFTAIDYTMTAMTNLGENIGTLFKRVFDAVRGEISFSEIFDAEFKNILEGASNQIPELPKIPKRQIGEYEQSLIDNVRGMEESLDKELGEFMVKRRKDLLGETDKTIEAVENVAGKLANDDGDITQATNVDLGLTQTQKNAITLQSNSANDPNQKTADNTEKMLSEQERQTAVLNELNNSVLSVNSSILNQPTVSAP